MAKTKLDASVLAFEKKLAPSDGFFYGTTWNARADKAHATPLALIEKSVRGTISNRQKAAVANDPTKLNAKVEEANLQTVDTCALGEHQDTLKLHFTLKVLGGVDQPSASNGAEFNKSYPAVAKRYIETYGFTELAKRYAMNLANGRFLWRNRVGAEQVETVISVGDKSWTFNGFDFSLKHFDGANADIQELVTIIAQALSGQRPYLLINVTAYAKVGQAQEVYPSEELVLDKGKGDKSKILYHVKDIAAMHSQKIGNAIRCIDTWYPDYATENGVGPIAVEPYGSVTNLGKAYRNPKEKNDFYTLFDAYAMGEELPADKQDQEHYVMAVLVRGGVFGQKQE